MKSLNRASTFSKAEIQEIYSTYPHIAEAGKIFNNAAVLLYHANGCDKDQMQLTLTVIVKLAKVFGIDDLTKVKL